MREKQDRWRSLGPNFEKSQKGAKQWIAVVTRKEATYAFISKMNVPKQWRSNLLVKCDRWWFLASNIEGIRENLLIFKLNQTQILSLTRRSPNPGRFRQQDLKRFLNISPRQKVNIVALHFKIWSLSANIAQLCFHWRLFCQTSCVWRKLCLQKIQ